MNKVLLTGGTGYIGSHTCFVLLKKGFKVVVLDSLVNSSVKSLEGVKKIFGKDWEFYGDKLKFIRGDINDFDLLIKLFKDNELMGESIDGVIHFAGLKCVCESIKNPIKYWESNVLGTMNLIKVMNLFSCHNIIFSSSATVYGVKNSENIKESSIVCPTNPYGSTKATVENFLKDVYLSNKKKWNIINLRYFNPIGSHPSGLIGESPVLIPNNVFPILMDVAFGIKEELKIFGNDWDTFDGTCIRDYVHVMDLAEAHVKSFEFLFSNKPQFLNINIGTGKGTSVLELVNTFMKVNKVSIKISFTSRRDGDLSSVIADNAKAKEILNWTPIRDLSHMCIDGWTWKRLNPEGYN